MRSEHCSDGQKRELAWSYFSFPDSFQPGLGRRGGLLKNWLSAASSQNFQASEVEGEEAELPEESFTSTKEFKVTAT